jgi:hypothetical protein
MLKSFLDAMMINSESNLSIEPNNNKENPISLVNLLENQIKIEKSKNKLNIYYSSYGYIKLIKSDKPEEKDTNELLKFTQIKYSSNLENPIIGTIYHKNLRNTINIKIKTFFNEREIYTIEQIDIHSPLHTAIEKLFSQKKENQKSKENKSTNIEYLTAKSQYRIFSCRRNIHELNRIRSFYENEIYDEELLIYLPIQELSYSQYIKGSAIVVSQKNKIASKVNTDSPQYALGDMYYSFGKHYFEYNLLTLPIDTSIIIGVATKKNQKDKYSYDVNSFYGIIVSSMCLIWMEKNKQYKKEMNKNKKDSYTINDIVGVLLEFKKEGLEISFYKNKILVGVAYTKIPENYFYPAISLGIAGSKVQISNQIDFP